jgi:transcriptional regulator with XRE-family HTH domain
MEFNLKHILKEYDIKQKELAAILNVKPPAISKYVNKTRKMSAEQIKTLAKHLNVTVDYLYHESSDKTVTISKIDLDKIREYQKAIYEILEKYK